MFGNMVLKKETKCGRKNGVECHGGSFFRHERGNVIKRGVEERGRGNVKN